MTNPIGTFPANFVGYSENPSVGPLTALELNTGIASCLWFANINVANGVCGLDGSALIPVTNINIATLLTAIIAGLPTSLPGSSGVMWNNGGIVSIS